MAEKDQGRMRQEDQYEGKTQRMMKAGETVKPESLLNPAGTTDKENLQQGAERRQEPRQSPICKQLTGGRTGELVPHNMVDMIPSPEAGDDG